MTLVDAGRVALATGCQCPKDKRSFDAGLFDTSYTVSSINSLMNKNISGIGANNAESVNVPLIPRGWSGLLAYGHWQLIASATHCSPLAEQR